MREERRDLIRAGDEVGAIEVRRAIRIARGCRKALKEMLE
jgi:hypothetical protein